MKRLQSTAIYMQIQTAISTLSALSALLHDWGKANSFFQDKLKSNAFLVDPLRHEYVSCLMFYGLVKSTKSSQDIHWINMLANNSWNEVEVIEHLKKLKAPYQIFNDLPPIAAMIAWLIVTHHRLPIPLNTKNQYVDYSAPGFTDVMDLIDADWGYHNHGIENYIQGLKDTFNFNNGILKSSSSWTNLLSSTAKTLLELHSEILNSVNNGTWRVLLHHSRLCMMLADHYYSSCGSDVDWPETTHVYANTDMKTKSLKQKLDEHLSHVAMHSINIAENLHCLNTSLSFANKVDKLSVSAKGFEWQDQAVSSIKTLRSQSPNLLSQGWFVVNMASTGKGKTIANAKIMAALSKEGHSLRYILALGLRTLTLQTGDSYKSDLDLTDDQVAVVIGSQAVKELHEASKNQNSDIQDAEKNLYGSESTESLFSDYLKFNGDVFPKALDLYFAEDTQDTNKAFLDKPLLVCTIDHIIKATETTRGGKYILPCLRLLTSDLVIDEVDDFDKNDLMAISRLIHLAGMLGRKVMISSATIPPSLAEGMFNAYMSGWNLYSKSHGVPCNVVAMWVDEFQSKTAVIENDFIATYSNEHKHYIKGRVNQLSKQIVKHHSVLLETHDLLQKKNGDLFTEYFSKIQHQAIKFHHAHHTKDPVSGKNVSFGIIRVANIQPCIDLTKYLLNSDWGVDCTPRIMAYHSRQILLLRSEQERHLDIILKRKERPGQQPIAFSDPIIRSHIDNTPESNVLFILVATPVAEVGRDHDYDWCICEPSSYRSIIQMSGRVLRHRLVKVDMKVPNIALMQYNIKGMKGQKVAFTRPGYEENNTKFRLKSKNLSLIFDSQSNVINAIPRISENDVLDPTNSLADLEHAVIANLMVNPHKVGPKELNGWLKEAWCLTSLPQYFYPFRKSEDSILLCAVIHDNQLKFFEKDKNGAMVDRTSLYDITQYQLSNEELNRLWLTRDFHDSLCRIAAKQVYQSKDIQGQILDLALKFGEISLPEYMKSSQLQYSDQLGLFVNQKREGVEG